MQDFIQLCDSSEKGILCMCIFFVVNVEEHQKCFLKTRAVRNSCSRGNIDRSKNALAETDMIYVYILRSKGGRTPEMLS